MLFYCHYFAIILQYLYIVSDLVPGLHLFSYRQLINSTDICLFQLHDSFMGTKFLPFELVT